MRKIDDDWYKDDYHAIDTLTHHIAIAQVKFDCSKLDVIQTHIQSDAKIKKQMITLNRLSRNEWRDAMNSILIDIWRIKFDYRISVDIKVENSYVAFEIVSSSTFLTRSIQIVDESINSLARRRTRIVQQKKRATIVRDRNEQQEDNMKTFLEKWLCKSDVCNNEHNFCFVKEEKHYKLTSAQQENWANAIFIDRDDVSFSESSKNLKHYLIHVQKVVSNRSRNFDSLIVKKFFVERMNEIMKTQLQQT